MRFDRHGVQKLPQRKYLGRVHNQAGFPEHQHTGHAGSLSKSVGDLVGFLLFRVDQEQPLHGLEVPVA